MCDNFIFQIIKKVALLFSITANLTPAILQDGKGSDPLVVLNMIRRLYIGYLKVI